MKLSILIPSLENRKIYLQRILGVLNPQIVNGEVEILTLIDNGERSIGDKRNQLISDAKGDYIAFVDDDDLVSSDYVHKVLGALSTSPDCIGIHLLHFEDGNLLGFTYHSLEYKSWFDTTDLVIQFKRYYRNPNHINPIKRKIAIKHPFPSISMGEDRAYSMSVLKDLYTEVYIKEPIYYYLFRSKK